MNANTPQVGVADLAAILETATNPVLIDVRQPDEWLEARVQQARLVPLASVPDIVDELPRDTAVYVICHSGGRSERAASWLRQFDIDAINVAGGTMAWQQAGYDVASGPAA
jgi:rhodanese-related sulfurtransferase